MDGLLNGKLHCTQNCIQEDLVIKLTCPILPSLSIPFLSLSFSLFVLLLPLPLLLPLRLSPSSLRLVSVEISRSTDFAAPKSKPNSTKRKEIFLGKKKNHWDEDSSRKKCDKSDKPFSKNEICEKIISLSPMVMFLH